MYVQQKHTNLNRTLANAVQLQLLPRSPVDCDQLSAVVPVQNTFVLRKIITKLSSYFVIYLT